MFSIFEDILKMYYRSKISIGNTKQIQTNKLETSTHSTIQPSKTQEQLKIKGTWFLPFTFIAFWYLLQWLVSKITNVFVLYEADYYTITTAQALFSISTFVPIALWIWQDVRTLYYRSKIEVNKTKQIQENIRTYKGRFVPFIKTTVFAGSVCLVIIGLSFLA